MRLFRDFLALPMVLPDMTIEVTTLTLAFDPLLEGFPNERLRDFAVGREILAVDSFSFVHGWRCPAGSRRWRLTRSL